MVPLPTREQQQQRCVAGSYIFLIYFSSSSPNSGLPTSPSPQPTTPLHCMPTLRPAASPNPKCRKACLIFCAFFISETPTSPTPPNTLLQPHPCLRLTVRRTDRSSRPFFHHAGERQKQQQQQQLTLNTLPPPFHHPSALTHRIALSASGVALRRVVVVAVVAAFLLATRKKSNKNNCHFPPHPATPSLRHAALPSTNGLPTRLQLTSHSRSQLNSTHLTSHLKSQPTPLHNTPLTIPPSPAPPHVACPMPPKPFTKLGTQLFVNSSAAAIRFGHG